MLDRLCDRVIDIMAPILVLSGIMLLVVMLVLVVVMLVQGILYLV